jgi:hypothetical protein
MLNELGSNAGINWVDAQEPLRLAFAVAAAVSLLLAALMLLRIRPSAARLLVQWTVPAPQSTLHDSPNPRITYRPHHHNQSHYSN